MKGPDDRSTFSFTFTCISFVIASVWLPAEGWFFPFMIVRLNAYNKRNSDDVAVGWSLSFVSD